MAPVRGVHPRRASGANVNQVNRRDVRVANVIIKHEGREIC
jgi:hypothetical protein